MARDTDRLIGQLRGRVLLRGSIRCLTGLHIGARNDDPAVAGIDEPVLRDPLTLRPYIPGSTLRGKLRSLSEQAEGLSPNWETGGVRLHLCTKSPACVVCRLFGVPSQLETARPARLIVRDTFLSDDSARRLEALRTDLPFTEVRVETAVDRRSAAVAPREIELVPASAVFSDMELVLNVYTDEDLADFSTLVRSLALLEDDYLGGGGSRGSGSVRCEQLAVTPRSVASYGQPPHAGSAPQLEAASIGDLLERSDEVLTFLRQQIPIPEEEATPDAEPSDSASSDVDKSAVEAEASATSAVIVTEPPPPTEALPPPAVPEGAVAPETPASPEPPAEAPIVEPSTMSEAAADESVADTAEILPELQSEVSAPDSETGPLPDAPDAEPASDEAAADPPSSVEAPAAEPYESSEKPQDADDAPASPPESDEGHGPEAAR